MSVVIVLLALVLLMFVASLLKTAAVAVAISVFYVTGIY
jgi:hypothetical protein